MDNDYETAKSIGLLEGRVGALEKEVRSFHREVRTEMEQLSGEVRGIRSTLDQAGGSWKTILAIGGFIAVVSGAVAAFATWMSVAPK